MFIETTHKVHNTYYYYYYEERIRIDANRIFHIVRLANKIH